MDAAKQLVLAFWILPEELDIYYSAEVIIFITLFASLLPPLTRNRAVARIDPTCQSCIIRQRIARFNTIEVGDHLLIGKARRIDLDPYRVRICAGVFVVPVEIGLPPPPALNLLEGPPFPDLLIVYRLRKFFLQGVFYYQF